jgi:hypothetical protein
MTIADRRSGAERRAVGRSKVTLDVEWENVSGRHSGTLSDINEYGCFVLSSGEFTEGETLKLFLPIGEGMKLEIAGKVKNKVFEIGFALRFVGLTEAQKRVLREFISGQ